MAKTVKFFLLAGFIALLTGCAGASPETPAHGFRFEETEFDFGVVKQSAGIARHDFPFVYGKETPVIITGTPASCACTTGKIDKTEFKKGEKGILTVEFDPNLHEEPQGKFYKTVSLLTDPPLTTRPEVKIWVEIDLDLGPDAYRLREHID